jgi:hypothetical protein
MDKFPEAFDRFCKDVNVNNIETFKQLKAEFASWAGRNWLDSFEQERALAVEARKLGIPTEGYRSREEQVQTIFQTTREIQAIEQRKEIQREKRFSVSYVSFPVWMYKTTRTTRYQQRVINYIRNHPDANLREARGHRKR